MLLKWPTANVLIQVVDTITNGRKGFTKKDFKAVIDIGVGSKRGDNSKIGKFGRGALTM